VPIGVVGASNGQYYVSDPVHSTVVAVDPRNGARARLKPFASGPGLKLEAPVGIGEDRNGNLLVTDLKGRAVYSIGLGTSDLRVLSSPTIGSGPPFKRPWGIVVGPADELYVSDSELGAILRIDPATGDRTVVLPSP
jgi:streptogramin lyase